MKTKKSKRVKRTQRDYNLGFKLSNNMNAENVVKAFIMAIKQRKTNKELHYSDRGLQYSQILES